MRSFFDSRFSAAAHHRERDERAERAPGEEAHYEQDRQPGMDVQDRVRQAGGAVVAPQDEVMIERGDVHARKPEGWARAKASDIAFSRRGWLIGAMPDAGSTEMLALRRRVPDGAITCPTKFLHPRNHISAGGWRRFYLAVMFGLIRVAGPGIQSRNLRRLFPSMPGVAKHQRVIKDIII